MLNTFLFVIQIITLHSLSQSHHSCGITVSYQFISFINFIFVLGINNLNLLNASKSPAKRFDHYEHQRLYAQGPEQAEVENNRKGYSIGSGLRSIAQGSADQANSAVANQHAAATQAAYVAKSTLG